MGPCRTRNKDRAIGSRSTGDGRSTEYYVWGRYEGAARLKQVIEASSARMGFAEKQRGSLPRARDDGALLASGPHPLA